MKFDRDQSRIRAAQHPHNSQGEAGRGGERRWRAAEAVRAAKLQLAAKSIAEGHHGADQPGSNTVSINEHGCTWENEALLPLPLMAPNDLQPPWKHILELPCSAL